MYDDNTNTQRDAIIEKSDSIFAETSSMDNNRDINSIASIAEDASLHDQTDHTLHESSGFKSAWSSNSPDNISRYIRKIRTDIRQDN